jgi:hypothetical protein
MCVECGKTSCDENNIISEVAVMYEDDPPTDEET